MKYGCMLYVLGDVNGNFNLLNRFIDKKIRQNHELRSMSKAWEERGDSFEAAILQCGDFGFFDSIYDKERGAAGIIKNDIDFLEYDRIPIFWCHGDRDNHWRLAQLVPEDHFDELHPVDYEREIVACDFGSVYFLARDTWVMFCGGADSPHEKRPGIKDYEMKLAEVNFSWKPEIIISHTAPAIFGFGDTPAAVKLNYIFDQTKPRYWFFSHPQKSVRGEVGRCKWKGLAPLGEDGCFAKLFIQNERGDENHSPDN